MVGKRKKKEENLTYQNLSKIVVLMKFIPIKATRLNHALKFSIFTTE